MSEKMSEYILEMTNIEKQFPGVKALDKANLMLKKGSVHALNGREWSRKKYINEMSVRCLCRGCRGDQN